LEIQSEKQPSEHAHRQKSSHTNPPSRRPSRWIEPSADSEVIHLTGTEVHGTLQRSVKSIDQAAKIAQNLGNLMSKVALQQNEKQQERFQNNNDTSLKQKSNLTSATNSSMSTFATATASTSTSTSKGVGIGTPSISIDPGLKDLLDKDRKRNPYNPIADEIKKRADRLAEVVEQAEQNLKLHGAAFGLNSYPEEAEAGSSSGKNSSRISNVGKSKRTSVSTTSTGTDPGSGRGLQRESSRNKISDETPSTEFEFLSDMSYTDQLMLKKLRALKSSWCD